MDSKVYLHYGIYGHIEPYWDGATYYGTCWRLHYNHTHGARVQTRYETVDMSPEYIYLLPPRVSFKATQKQNPKQLGLHFDASEPYDHVQPSIYAIPIDSLLNELLEKTLSEIRPHPFVLSDAGQMYATALIAAALAEVPAESVETESVDLRVEEAMQYFRERIDKHVSIEDAAASVGLSKGAFIRLFKHETGSTPYAWLMEIRISYTCDLLARDSVPIDLIAQYTGFNDRFHLSKTFKKMIGISPAVYRRREQPQKHA